MRHREHSPVDDVLLRAPTNRCGLSQSQNSLVLEFSEEAGHAIVIPQGKRGLAWRTGVRGETR
jgi:hypothetical protein